MYARVSPLGLAWSVLCAMTILFLVVTAQLFQDWRIETAGVWSMGTIVSINRCYNSHGVRLATVHLDVHFTDHHEASHISQTDCEYNRYNVGQSISVRYLPENPSHILIPADINGGQGLPLIVLLALDAICVPLSVLATVYALRRMRRQEAERAEARRQQIEYFAARRAAKGTANRPQVALPRRTRKSLR